MTLYLDTSALVKILTVEPESAALRRYLESSQGSVRISSALARTELRRAVLRTQAALLPRVPALLDGLALLRLDDSLLDAAGALAPAGLRSLDALHLASAMRVAPLRALVTYDARMLQAAEELGLPVAAPA